MASREQRRRLRAIARPLGALLLPLAMARGSMALAQVHAAPASRDAGAADGGPAPSGLDFGAVEVPVQSVSPARPSRPERSALWAWGVILLLAGLVAAAAWAGRRPAAARSPLLDLGAAPLAARLAISFLLLLYAATRGLALATIYLDTRVVYQSTEEYFTFLKAARLTALSHAHLMGIGTMDGITALLYSFSRPPSSLSAAVVTMAFLGILGDVASWWLIKYVGRGFELLSLFTGTLLCSLGFTIMAAGVLWDSWRRPLRGATR